MHAAINSGSMVRATLSYSRQNPVCVSSCCRRSTALRRIGTAVIALLGVRTPMIARWAHEGKLTPLRTSGDHRRYSRADIRRILTDEMTPHDAQQQLAEDAARPYNQGWSIRQVAERQQLRRHAPIFANTSSREAAGEIQPETEHRIREGHPLDSKKGLTAAQRQALCLKTPTRVNGKLFTRPQPAGGCGGRRPPTSGVPGGRPPGQTLWS